MFFFYLVFNKPFLSRLIRFGTLVDFFFSCGSLFCFSATLFPFTFLCSPLLLAIFLLFQCFVAMPTLDHSTLRAHLHEDETHANKHRVQITQFMGHNIHN